jgi:Pentapeptide repeats (9 copies)
MYKGKAKQLSKPQLLMPDSPTSEPGNAFVCKCAERDHSACAGGQYKNNDYCVLHFPGNEKSNDFVEILKEKVRKEDFNFSGVWFPDDPDFLRLDFTAFANFEGATFSGDGDFSGATFRADVSFRHATFSGKARFWRTTFRHTTNFKFSNFSSDADFTRAVFDSRVEFVGCIFHSAAHFSETTFRDEANFDSTNFGEVHFSKASFIGKLSFTDANFFGEANFDESIFADKADFTRATFRNEADFVQSSFKTEAKFPNATFGSNVDFIGTIFAEKADFYKAKLSSARFLSAAFSGSAIFMNAEFGRAGFNGARFNAGAYFTCTTFSAEADFFCDFGANVEFNGASFAAEANFGSSTFGAKAIFDSASFKDYVKFEGDPERPMFSATSSLDLQFARIEKPDHVAFHTVSLRPHWFVNVDASKFDFTNVGWAKLTKVDSDRRSIEREIECLRSKEVTSPHRLLSVACWRLATNAEENHRYPEASGFRYMAMDASRREHWRFGLWRLSVLYWLASGYGERILRATVVLIGILVLSAGIYTRVGFSRSEPKLTSESGAEATKQEDVNARLDFWRALIYSAEVMAFQKPEPRPATFIAHLVVLLETILGPVQAALLLLAIRRKFMR